MVSDSLIKTLKFHFDTTNLIMGRRTWTWMQPPWTSLSHPFTYLPGGIVSVNSVNLAYVWSLKVCIISQTHVVAAAGLAGLCQQAEKLAKCAYIQNIFWPWIWICAGDIGPMWHCICLTSHKTCQIRPGALANILMQRLVANQNSFWRKT
jgi:hypothetical protein